jgi:hypothetical protein
MSPLIAVAEHIAQARQLNDGSPTLPWSSFEDFFKFCVYDQRLVNRPFLTYYDDDRQLQCTYSYAVGPLVVHLDSTFALMNHHPLPMQELRLGKKYRQRSMLEWPTQDASMYVS